MVYCDYSIGRLTMKISTYFSDPKRIFLLDGLGAFVSAIILISIYLVFNTYFGMPTWVFGFQAGIATFFAVFSLSCFLFLKSDWKVFLKTICFLNASYCCLTIIFQLVYIDQLTVFDVLFFTTEIGVISLLVYLETKLLRQ